MKLYYTPGACSLSPHIVLREAGADFELERVDLKTGKTESGADFGEINAKGYVPTLQLDDGQVLTEGAAIVQYVADSNGAGTLAPKPGTLERARLQEHLNFTATELHKAFGPFFSADASEADKQAAATKVGKRLDHYEALFADGRSYLLGEDFSVADAYLFTIASWTVPTGIGLDRWPHLAAFSERVAGREKVQDALRAEGLI